MKVENVNLKTDSVLIADVHYRRGDVCFLKLLKEWIKKPPPQVFFLGDIFHLLLPFSYLTDYNREAVDLINELSKKTEVYYTPGNHDFNIEKVFPDVVFADAFVDEEKKVFLTHGDLTDSDLSYKMYLLLVRNEFLENLLHILSLNFVNSWLFKRILKKNISCAKIENFEKKIKKKLILNDYGIIIEGHYHQNRIIKNSKVYINLPAFVCTKSFCIFKGDKKYVKEIRYDG